MSELIERFVREGLASPQHPGIVFKPGPAGRRAALAGGPDVWEVVAAVRRATGPEARRVRSAATELGLHERQVATALDYGAARREEIERIIAENELALEDAERLAAERVRLLE